MQFKIRASASGKIVGLPRSKKDREAGILSEGAKTYCEDWLKEQLYKRRKEFTSKYTDKGNVMEDNSLDFIAERLKYGILIKNEKRYENDFMTGTPDVVLENVLIDVKNSWDCFTFPRFAKEIPNKDYYWQAQSYMELTGVDKYKLIYVLSDTPKHLIEREAFFYAKNNGYEELSSEMYDEFEKKMTYGDIDNKDKIKVFDIDRNDEDIDFIMEQVVKCRNFINGLS